MLFAASSRLLPDEPVAVHRSPREVRLLNTGSKGILGDMGRTTTVPCNTIGCLKVAAQIKANAIKALGNKQTALPSQYRDHTDSRTVPMVLDAEDGAEGLDAEARLGSGVHLKWITTANAAHSGRAGYQVQVSGSTGQFDDARLTLPNFISKGDSTACKVAHSSATFR